MKFSVNNINYKRLRRYKMKKLGILAVYLFGSVAEGVASDSSDIDIGIVLKNPEYLEDTLSLYNALYEELSRIFRPTFHRELDIVFLQKAPKTLQYNAITSGRVIYEEDPVKRVEYEERVIKEYLDFKPILEYFDRAASERYA